MSGSTWQTDSLIGAGCRSSCASTSLFSPTRAKESRSECGVLDSRTLQMRVHCTTYILHKCALGSAGGVWSGGGARASHTGGSHRGPAEPDPSSSWCATHTIKKKCGWIKSHGSDSGLIASKTQGALEPKRILLSTLFFLLRRSIHQQQIQLFQTIL